MKVQKRDGSFVNFDEDKIYIALYAANEEVYNVNPAYSITEEQLWDVVHRVCAILNNEDTTVEAIQDLVEAVLISRNYFYIATSCAEKNYELLHRNKLGENKKSVMKIYPKCLTKEGISNKISIWLNADDERNNMEDGVHERSGSQKPSNPRKTRVPLGT